MIERLAEDPSESNAYIVTGTISCIIDPGISPARLFDHRREYNTSTQSLINTHCHFDHVGANEGVLSIGDIEAICHKNAAQALESGDDSMQLASLFGREPVRHHVDRKVAGGDTIDLGGLVLEVIHTPGHTSGCISLYEPASKTLFSGDAVFVGSIGRTDFPTGDMRTLGESVERLLELVETRGVERLCPGHGPEGTGQDIIDVYTAFF